MAQSSGGAGTGGMGSLFAGIMQGWDGVGKIFDDIEVTRKSNKIRQEGEDQIAKDRAATTRAYAGSPKLSTALLEAPDTGTDAGTTRTATTPYAGPKLAGSVNVEAIPTGAAPAGGPSGTTTAAPVLITGLPPPSGDVGYPFPTQGRPTAAFPALPPSDVVGWAANPDTSGPGFPSGGGTTTTAASIPPSRPLPPGTTPLQRAMASGSSTSPSTQTQMTAPTSTAPAAAPAAAPDETPGQDYGGGGDKKTIPSFGSQAEPARAQFSTAEALPTAVSGAGTTLGSPYTNASLGQSLLGLDAVAGRRAARGLDYTPEQQQAIATAPQMAARARPRIAQQQVIPALLPQVDLFGNPIMPVRNV